MADDIIYRIGADTTDLDTAMAKVKGSMPAAGTPASGLATPLPAALGGAPRPPTLLESATAKAATQSAAEMEAAKQKYKEFAQAENEVGEAANRAGIDIGRMIERIAIRLVIFEAIRLAIKAISDAAKESAAYELMEARFENLSTSAKTAAADFENLANKARAIGADPAGWVKINETLIKAGESAHNAALETETLGKYAEESGDSADALTSAFERVKLSTGTIEDMRTLVSVMGEAGNALRDQINSLQQEEILQNRINEQIQFQNMLREHAYEQQQRQIRTTEEFGDKLGLANEVFQDIQQSRPGAGYVERAGVDVSEQAEFMFKREEAGERQIEQEEHLSYYQLRRLEAAGYINEKDLLAAAQRKTEAEHQAELQKQQEDQMRRRMEIEQKSLELQKEVLAAVQVQRGLTERLAKEQATAAAEANKQKQAFAEMAQRSEAIRGMLGAWNEAMSSLVNNFKTVATWIDHIYETLVKMGWVHTAASKAPVMSGGINVNPQYTSQGPMTLTEALFRPPSAARWEQIHAWEQSPAGQAATQRTHQLMEQQLEILRTGLLQ